MIRRRWLESWTHASPAAAFSQFARPGPWRGRPKAMGYAVRTAATHRYVEWRRFGTREIVARELYAYHHDRDLFETENLAHSPADAARMRELAAMLP